jgi:hypothetical protein
MNSLGFSQLRIEDWFTKAVIQNKSSNLSGQINLNQGQL